jgi:hypothetical protein
MKKVNTKLQIPKLRTVCKYQQNQSVRNTGNETDPTVTTATITDIVIGGW